jgi:DNA-binding GntR family transcriptional regulator
VSTTERPADRGRVSLVDHTERTLRDWLAQGGRRAGDRLPPELELAGMLGVSRGTLRTALERLERGGEIVRRQGSGTYVGRLRSPTTLDEGLEVLVSYSRLAARRGLELTVRDLRLAREPLEPAAAEAFGLPPGAEAPSVTRVVMVHGQPAALMRDRIHPDVPLPPPARLRRALEGGQMVLDVLLEQGLPVAYARTEVLARLVTPSEPAGRALEVQRDTAMLELEEVIHLTSGPAVEHSTDLFAPSGLDLHVRRALELPPRAPPPAVEH